MHYLNITILGSPLEPFTYQSSQNINIGSKVAVKVRNRELQGVVISTCSLPEFNTSEILEVFDVVYSEKQLKLAKFISTYYMCALGESLALMSGFAQNSIDEVHSDIELNIELSDKQENALSFLKQHNTSQIGRAHV